MTANDLRRSQSGISLLEVMVVLGILAVTAVVLTPGFFSWHKKARLRGAADNLKGVLHAAKARAARESCWVVIEFFNNHYRVFVDNGAGGSGIKNNGVLDGSERIVEQRQLPADLRIEPSGFTRTHFNPRGTTGSAGTIHLVNAHGHRKKLIISPMGRIRMEDG